MFPHPNLTDPHRLRLSALVPLLLAARVLAGSPPTPADPLVGSWLGTLAAGPGQLRIVITVTSSGERLSGTLESPDQGATVPIDEIVREGDTVRMVVGAVSGAFRGSLRSGGNELQGTWIQGLPLPLTLRRLPAVPEPARGWVAGEASLEMNTLLGEVASEHLIPLGRLRRIAALADDWRRAPLPPGLRQRFPSLGALLENRAELYGFDGRGPALRAAAGLYMCAADYGSAARVLRKCIAAGHGGDTVRLLAEVAERAGPDGPRRRDGEDIVDALVQLARAEASAPAVSIAVARDGEIVKSAGYGLASLELRTPAGPDTVYEIGSITKQFTAVLVMMLVEEGKVDLDAPASRYLDGLPAEWAPVTVRHLLTHTSGIRSYTEIPTIFSEPEKQYTPGALLDLVRSRPLAFAPGTAWSYNNTGYFMLGMLLEKLTGESYGTLLREKLFAPADMTRTRVADARAVIPGRAAGYRLNGDSFVNAPFWNVSSRGAAGCIMSTAPDLLRWNRALREGKLVRPATLRRMWAEHRLPGGGGTRYGLGWAIDTERGRRRVSHGGGLPGWAAFLAQYPDDGLDVAVLTNLDGAVGAIAQRVVAHYLAGPPPGAPAIDPEAVNLVRLALDRLARRVDGEPAIGGLLADARFGGAESASGFVRRLGRPRRLEPLAWTKLPEGDYARCLVRFERAAWRVSAVRASDGELIWVGFQPAV